MLAPDASAGIAEKQVLFGYQNNELIIDCSVLDIQSPYPLLLFFAFRGIIISTDPKYKRSRSILYDDRKKHCRFKKK